MFQLGSLGADVILHASVLKPGHIRDTRNIDLTEII